MLKKFLLITFVVFVFLFPYPYTLYPSYAASPVPAGEFCVRSADNPCTCAQAAHSCQNLPNVSPTTCQCLPSKIQDIFGKIEPPDALKGFVQKDPTGAGGLSLFLSNLVTLIYGIAAVVLIFMLLWGAFDWMTAEGDKEKLERARNKIMNAIIGILLFAAAFGIIRILGQFTGFKFFSGQDQVQSFPGTVPASVPSARPQPSIGSTVKIIPAACTTNPCTCVTIPTVCQGGSTCKPEAPGHNNAGCAP